MKHWLIFGIIATCYFAGNNPIVYKNIEKYSDDMMSYEIRINENGKIRKIKLPKFYCTIEES